MSLLHIRCVPECEHQGSPLFLNDCGSCLYHKNCCPVWCRCGTKTKLTQIVSRHTCIYPKCSFKTNSDTNLLCKKHLESLDSFILNKLKILGKLLTSSFSELITFHSNQVAKGDIAFLAAHDLRSVVDRQWKVFYSKDGKEIVYFSIVVNDYVTENGVSVKEALDALNLPPEAYGHIMEDARLLRHSWVLDASRQPVAQHATKICDKKTMMKKLTTMSKPTIEIEKLVCLFPEAASIVKQLLDEKKVVSIDNGRLVCLNSSAVHEEDLLGYWMTHVDSL